MNINIIITQKDYREFSQQLFPLGDSNEHFGFGLAGVSNYRGGFNLLLREFIAADNSCLLMQSGASVRPDPIFIDYIWTLAKKSKSSLIDFHTHPFSDTNVGFSGIDDRSEMESFPKAVEYLGNGPHASVVFGRNSLDGRWYNPITKTLEPIATLKILGQKLTTIIPTSAKQLSFFTDKAIN